jgi:hypothetical protein
MKTIDFINFMEFETPVRGARKIGENNCSFLVNEKNKSFYFRFKDVGFNHLKIGQLNGKICFVLNKTKGFRGHKTNKGDTVAFCGKEMVFTVLKILYGSFNTSLFKGVLHLDKIEQNESHVILVVKPIDNEK